MTTHESQESILTPLPADTLLQERYRIVRQLGRGGMGAVYEAVDQRLGITVALKETLSAESAMRKQFEHEARLLASMQHPALPRVSDHFTEGNRAFLVMQFIGGVDLARIIAQQPGPFPRDQVIAWADQLLDALIYLHSRDRQVIHRDIKPHNLKVTANGQIALLDFGLAKAQAADPTASSSAAFYGYTRQYAPLEQIQDRRTDPRSDIYALGATLYHLLTGTKPPDALLRAAALVNGFPDPLKPACQIHATVGVEISAILLKAMAQKPEGRYASANEFREALRRLGRVEPKINQAGKVNEVGPIKTKHDGPRLRLDMVVSKKRFGPGAATVILMSTLGLGAGALYGSQRWLQSLDVSSAVPALSLKQSATSRRIEKARGPQAMEVSPPKVKNGVDNVSGRPAEKRDAAERSSNRVPRQKQPTKRVYGHRIDAPSIRMPNPEPRDGITPQADGTSNEN